MAGREEDAVSLLGETVRLRREERGLGQVQLADTLGVSQQTVSRWEKGLALPRPNRVTDLARVLEVDATHLARLAGYLPTEERSALSGPWFELYERMPELSRDELMLLLERAWEELRSREGLSPPGMR